MTASNKHARAVRKAVHTTLLSFIWFGLFGGKFIRLLLVLAKVLKARAPKYYGYAFTADLGIGGDLSFSGARL